MQCIRQALKQLDNKVDTIYLVGGLVDVSIFMVY